MRRRRTFGDQASEVELPLSSIRVLFRAPDALTLWGIPYEMRPGQSPRDLWRAYHEWTPPRPGWYGSNRPNLGWIYLGEPGWYGSTSPARVAEIKAFLTTHKEDIPDNPYEWSTLSSPKRPERASHGDLLPSPVKHAYAVERLSGSRVAVLPAFSAGEAVRSVSRRKGISAVLLRAQRLR
jgi:hypothetical protein